MNIFEQASMQKLRFESARGAISVEDLWDLPLTSSNPTTRPSLDAIAMNLYRQVKETGEIQSFVSDAVQIDATTQLGLDIVKHIIAHKKTAASKATDAKKRADLRQQLMEVLTRKKDQELETLSPAEIQAKIDALSGDPS